MEKVVRNPWRLRNLPVVTDVNPPVKTGRFLSWKTYWLALGKKVWLWILISPHANTSFERSDAVQSFSVWRVKVKVCSGVQPRGSGA